MRCARPGADRLAALASASRPATASAYCVGVVARVDEHAGVVVHELDVAGQRGRDDRHPHRQRLVDHVRHAFEHARHQQQVAGAVPARHLVRGRVPGDHPGDAELARPAAHLVLERPVADDVQRQADAALLAAAAAPRA